LGSSLPGARRASSRVCLATLGIIFAYAVFRSGGIVQPDWDRCLVALGVLALFYFRVTKREDLAPPLQWWFKWPPLLMLGFIGLQLVPLPAWLLGAISPARAGLLQSLDPVLPGSGFGTISVYPTATLAHLLRVAAYIVVFILSRELAWRTLDRRWLITVPILAVAGVEAILGIVQYSPDSVAQGTYVNRNHFAGLLELSLPFAAVYPIAVQMTRRRQPFRQSVLVATSVALAALMLLGIVLSLSRMAFAAALTSLFIVGSLALGERASAPKRFAVTALVAAIVIAGSLYLAPDPLISRFAEVHETPINVMPDARARVWKETLTLAADYALAGCGLGTFEHCFHKYRTFLPQLGIDSVHNDYLQLLAELGAIGFAIGAAAMIAVFVSAARAAFESTDSNTRFLAIACIGSLVAILIHSFTDYNLYIPANAMLLAWIAGIVASLNFGSHTRFKT
jgi:O-antigen ligase